MTKGNVVDLSDFRSNIAQEAQTTPHSMSPELESAIEDLIYQLRELGPLSKSGTGK